MLRGISFSPFLDDVLNSDIWVSGVGNSPYWRQVSKTVTLYGGALENITLDDNTLVTTNSDGSVTTSVPYGTHTYKGSVSGQSFSREVTKDTTEVKVMPEGALYWYGNDVNGYIKNGTLEAQNIGSNYSVTIPKLTMRTNSFNFYDNTTASGGSLVYKNTTINTRGYSKLNLNLVSKTSLLDGNSNIIIAAIKTLTITEGSNGPGYRDVYSRTGTQLSTDLLSVDISNINEFYFGLFVSCSSSAIIDKIWLE